MDDYTKMIYTKLDNKWKSKKNNLNKNNNFKNVHLNQRQIIIDLDQQVKIKSLKISKDMKKQLEDLEQVIKKQNKKKI